MSNHCVFCMILKGILPSNILYEDEKTLAFLDNNPSSPGHTLIIPKEHRIRLEELSKEEANSLFDTLHKLSKPIREAMEADALSIAINDGPESGQEIPHLHIHVIPRKKNDGKGVSQVLKRINQTNFNEFKKTADLIKEKII
ncbi:HIT family protein [Candidatus Bathyarchaeota archaeon]|nr:HIT family protein [Candidatus Bathyarchaeota archaeon]